MIRSFGDARTEDLYHGRRSRAVRGVPPELVARLLRKLDMLEAAVSPEDLRAPPGNRLEALAGELRGWFSVRVSSQWRLVFRWADGAAEDVQLIDYH